MKRIIKPLSFLTIGILAFTSCKKEVDEPILTSLGSADYGLITRTVNPDGQTFAVYLQRIASPGTIGTLDNSQATELTSSTQAGIYEYNGSVYLNDYANNVVDKWTLSDKNIASASGSMSTTELGFQGNICFKDNSTAFIGGPNVQEIVIFDPNSMQKTGKIDWSSLSQAGAVTDFPQAGATIQGEGISEMVISGNYMYAAIYYMYDFGTFTPAKESCDILVIDLTQVDPSSSDNSAALVGIISDNRGSFTGAWNSGGGTYAMKKVENGDVYMICHNVWGGHRQTTGKPACILRIQNGATTFDQNYYFDLESASGGSGNPVTNFEYYGDGKFLAAVQDPTQLDAGNPYSYYTDPIFRWWSFDLNAQSAVQIGNEYTKGALAAKCHFKDGFAYVPFDNNLESYINKVDLNSLTQERTLNTTGIPTILGFN